MIVAQLEFAGQKGNYMCVKLDQVIRQIEDHLEREGLFAPDTQEFLRPGPVLSLELIEMDKDQFEALPEWDPY